jgi:hypothetical protein
MTSARHLTASAGLAAGVWPYTARLMPAGEIVVGGIPLSRLAAR